MCGISAVLAFRATGIDMKEHDIFHQMLMTSTVRGMKGTGLFMVGDYESGLTKDEDTFGTNMVKHEGSPFDLFKGKPYNRITDELCRARFLVGHNRAPTRGEHNHHCAHPFEKDDIILVHNGTVTDIDGMKDFKSFEVDSEAICHWISRHSPQDSPKALGAINGAAALVWYDKRDQTLNMWRNWGRPLDIIRVGMTYYVASEGGMLVWLLNRANVGAVAYPLSLSTDMQFKFCHDDPDPELIKAPRETAKVTVFNLDNKGKVTTVTTPTTTVANTKTDTKTTKWLSAGEYFGLKKGSQVVIMPTNIERFEGGSTIFGKIVKVLGNPGAVLGFYEDLMVQFSSKKLSQKEMDNLYRAEVLKGTLVSIVLNTEDINQAKGFLHDVEEFDPTLLIGNDNKTQPSVQ